MKNSLIHLTRFVGLVLVTTLVLAGCGKGCAKKEVKLPGAETLALIPADNNFVIGIDWKKLSESPLGENMEKQIPSEATPFLKEISGVIMGFNIKGVQNKQKDFVAIVSGKLDSAKILAQITEQVEEEGGTVSDETYDGIKIYLSSKDPQMGMAFVGDQGVIGNKGAIKKVIDLTKKKGNSIEKNQALMDLIKTVDHNKMLWAVGLIPEGMIPSSQPGGPASPTSSFSGLKALDFSVDYKGDLSLDLGIIAQEEGQAQQMVTMANSYKALFGTSFAQKDPNVGKIFNSITIDQDGNRVAISLKLDKDTVEEISKKAQQKKEAAPTEQTQEAPAP